MGVDNFFDKFPDKEFNGRRQNFRQFFRRLFLYEFNTISLAKVCQKNRRKKLSDELSGDLSGNCRGDCRGSVGEFRCTSWQLSRKCGRAGPFEAPPRGGGGVFHCSLGLLRHHFGEKAGGGIQLQPKSSEALLKGGGREGGRVVHHSQGLLRHRRREGKGLRGTASGRRGGSLSTTARSSRDPSWGGGGFFHWSQGFPNHCPGEEGEGGSTTTKFFYYHYDYYYYITTITTITIPP